VVIDHFSRRAVGFTLFTKQPDAVGVREFLGQLMATVKATPNYLICSPHARPLLIFSAVYFAAFLCGRPRGRKVDSSPSRKRHERQAQALPPIRVIAGVLPFGNDRRALSSKRPVDSATLISSRAFGVGG
jgi:hypothetical protein